MTQVSQGTEGQAEQAPQVNSMSALSSVMTNDEITRLRAIGSLLANVRAPDEDTVIISFAVHAPDFDCDQGSVAVTVCRDGEEATAGAAGTDLATALLLARGKAIRQIEAKAAKRQRDKDRSGEADETAHAGSAAGKSLGPEGIALDSSMDSAS